MRIQLRGQIDGNHVGASQIDVEQIALDHARLPFQARFLDARIGRRDQFRRNLDSDGLGLILFGGGDQDPAIAATQIVERFTRLNIGDLEHAVHDTNGRGDVRRQFIPVAWILSNYRQTCQHRNKSSRPPHKINSLGGSLRRIPPVL